MTEQPKSAPQPWELTDIALHRLLALGRRVDRAACARTLRIALLGDAATQHYGQALSAVLKLRGWWPELYEAEYDTIQQEVLSPASGLHAHAPDCVVLFMTPQALMMRHGASPDKPNLALHISGEISELWAQLRQRLPGVKLLQHTYPVPVERPYGNQTLAQEETFAACIATLNAELWNAARAGRIALIDTETLASFHGKKHWFDERLWCQARQALSPSFLPVLAKVASDAILAEEGVSVKCVIVDLDNTMWGGILGDDGPDLIELGPAEVGHAFQRFQQTLAELKRRGVLLAVCSKNDPALVEDVLSTHPDLILRRDDFCVVTANFTDKPTNILAIRERLNLGLETFVFLDDSPFERNQVRELLPDVQVPNLPPDPADMIAALARWNLFEGRAATGEDRERHRYYQADTGREALRVASGDLESYLAGLDMEAEVRPFDAFTLPRVVQLLSRSNQFNVTTIRYTRAELDAMSAEEGVTGFSLRLVDRFGDNGIIAVVILRADNGDGLVDSWVMSCRVLGRGVEELILERIVDEARRRGWRRIIGRYIPTAKNGMVSELYTRLGFIRREDHDSERRFALDVQLFVPSPVHIRLRTGAAQEDA
jgi:FkbH-like protein